MNRPTLAAVAPLALFLYAGTATAQPDAPAPAAQAEAAVPEVTHSSTLWKKASEDIEGGYQIVETPGGTVLRLTDGFKTDSGPDLKVVLSPIAHDRVKGRTALEGSLVLGLLESNRGASEYRIPEGTDLSNYRSVLIHCEAYTKLWGAAPLSAGEVVAGGDEWTRKSNRIRGGWEIARTEAGYELRIDDTFRTKDAPDLKFVLSPQTIRDADKRNALRGGHVIAPLRDHEGAQTYAIPATVDLSEYRSLLIHCEQYTVLWGGVALGR